MDKYKKPVISIALCTYNGAKYVKEQLDSILKQTLLPSEIVACDDSSLDDTVDILRNFSRTAPFPVHIYVNDTNLGIAGNFGKAIKFCKGDFVAPCDQDDVWNHEKLDKLTRVLADNPESGYVFCNAELVDRKLQSLDRRLWDEKPNHFSPSGIKNFSKGEQFPLLLKKSFVTGACMMFRSSLVPHILPIPSPWIYDYWITTVAAALGNRGVLLDEPLVKYRQHEYQQIGILKGSTKSKLFAGLERWPGLLDRDIKRVEALQSHLKNLNPGREILNEIYCKYDFLKARSKMLSRPPLARPIAATKMLSKGHYNCYSPYGWPTFVMDIIAPGKKA